MQKFPFSDEGRSMSDADMKAALLIHNQMQTDKEHPFPVADKTGMDYYFLKAFLTREMEFDFPVIEQDFLRHCRDRLTLFDETGWYDGEEFFSYSPQIAIKKRILRLMYNGARLDDAYCKELIKTLFRLYHKKLYNQLKRFSAISYKEIVSLSTDAETDDCDLRIIGMVLGMCHIMKIRIDDSAFILYLELNDRMKEWISIDEEQRKRIEITEDAFKEALRQAELWTEEEKKLPEKKRNKTFWKEVDFIGECMQFRGYPDDYLFRSMDNFMGLTMQYARVLALLKTLHPNREYSFEEIQHYVASYSLVSALTCVVEEFDFETGYLTGDRIDEYEIQDSLFKPDMIRVKETKEKPAEKKIELPPVKKEDYLVERESLVSEIESLRNKLKSTEAECSYLREQARKLKSEHSEKQSLIEKYESERDELTALRAFVYSLDMEEASFTEEAFEEMQKKISEKAVVIIGGHTSWISKMKGLYPNWMFVHPDAYKTVDGKMLEGKEMVYFFTDYLNHISYVKFVAILREMKIPFGYLKSRNNENLIRQVYEDLF